MTFFGNFLLKAPRPPPLPPLQIRANFLQNPGGAPPPFLGFVQKILKGGPLLLHHLSYTTTAGGGRGPILTHHRCPSRSALTNPNSPPMQGGTLKGLFRMLTTTKLA